MLECSDLLVAGGVDEGPIRAAVCPLCDITAIAQRWLPSNA